MPLPGNGLRKIVATQLYLPSLYHEHNEVHVEITGTALALALAYP